MKMKQPLIKFFKIIRWKNVLIYLVLQCLIYFVLAGKHFSITDGWFFLTLSITFFGIFGNIQNNITDYERDLQKKNFTDFNLTIYLIWAILFLVLGFLTGFTAFYMSFEPYLLYAVILFPIILSMYNYYLKKTALTGNLTIALLTAFAIYIPVKFAKNIQINPHILYLLLSMAFWLTFLRELAKDLEDMTLDRKAGFKTLPVLHENFSRYFLMFLSFLTPFLLFYFKTYFNGIIFGILLIVSILITLASIFTIYKKQYENATKLYKFWMIFGILSVIFL